MTIGRLEMPGRRDVPESEILKEIGGGPDVNHVGGIYDPDLIGDDLLRIEALYWRRGKASVKVREPKITRHGSAIDVELPIEEGPTFHYGAIAITALGAHPERLPLHRGEQFDRDRVVEAIAQLQDSHPGAQVSPSTTLDLTTNTIAITFEVTWRYPWQALGLLPRR